MFFQRVASSRGKVCLFERLELCKRNDVLRITTCVHQISNFEQSSRRICF